MRKKLRKIGIFFTELLYPVRCPGCDTILPVQQKKKGFCINCQKHVLLVGKNVCMKCGRPLRNEAAEYCETCEKTEHIFSKGRAVFQYTGPMKGAMYRFKYSNKRCYGRIFASIAAKMYATDIKRAGIEAIIPVPMYKKKKRIRGYNQAEVFARQLSYELELPLLSEYIIRIVDSKPMKELNPIQRKENIQNAFKLSENKVQLNKVLLVDDIYTTGSTVDAVSKVLLEHGVKEVFCLCTCIGERI